MNSALQVRGSRRKRRTAAPVKRTRTAVSGMKRRRSGVVGTGRSRLRGLGGRRRSTRLGAVGTWKRGRERRAFGAAGGDVHGGAAPAVDAMSIEEAFERGRYEGGERLLELSAPPGHSLADLTLPEVISAGIEVLRHRLVPIMDAGTVCAEVEAALAEQRPISVVRLGDGELLALAQETVYEPEQIRREAPFLPKAGIEVPDRAAREMLADAVRQATIVGVPLSRARHFGPLLAPALLGNGIDLRTLRLTDSTVNYSLHLNGLLARLLQDRRILVIGNSAHGLAAKLAEAGLTVTGAVSPVNGFADIDRVVSEAAAIAGSYDLALVAAGIPAVVIASRIASEYGKAAFDFGHLADHIAGGQVKLMI